MATEAQMAANWINAQKSTGPRTAEGKAAVSQNAVTHGLLAAQAVVRGESVEEYEAHREVVLADLRPVGAVESILAERIVGLMWRLRRVQRLESETFEVMYRFQARPCFGRMTRDEMAKISAGPQGEMGQADFVVGQALRGDFASEHVLERLGLYERRIERSLYRTMAELRRIQEIRRAQETAEDAEGGTEEVQKDRKVHPQPARSHVPMLPRGLSMHPVFVEAHEETPRREDRTEVTVGGLNG